jgi:hypothetical protein
MFLMQSSLERFNPILAQNGHSNGSFDDDSPEQLQISQAGPLLNICTTGYLSDETAERGAFPFCTWYNSASTSVTTTDTGIVVVTGTQHTQKREEEADMSVNEPPAKRTKIATSTDRKATVIAGVQHNTADDAIYEPQPKRRKISHCTTHNFNGTFGRVDEVFASNKADTDDEGFADDEADSDEEVETDNESFTDHEAEFSHENFANDGMDSGDDSFAGDEVDTASSEDDDLSVEDDNGSNLSRARSPTEESISSPLIFTPSPTNASNAFQYRHFWLGYPTRCSVTSMDMLQFSHGLQQPPDLLTPQPKIRGSRRHRSEEVTIYEDDTATPLGGTEAGLTDDDRIPTVSHHGLSTASRGQENRQPVRPQVERPLDATGYLDESDGGEEEMVRMPGLGMLNPNPWLF